MPTARRRTTRAATDAAVPPQATPSGAAAQPDPQQQPPQETQPTSAAPSPETSQVSGSSQLNTPDASVPATPTPARRTRKRKAETPVTNPGTPKRKGRPLRQSRNANQDAHTTDPASVPTLDFAPTDAPPAAVTETVTAPTIANDPVRAPVRSSEPPIDPSKMKILVPTELRGNQKHDVLPGTQPSDRAREAVLVDVEEFENDQVPSGENKVDADGQLKGDRVYAIKTFRIPTRHPRRLYMMGPQAAKRIGFRDTYVFFIRNPNLVRLWATEEDRACMDTQGLVPSHLRTRPIALVTARSMFKSFGHLVVKEGKWSEDDYKIPTGPPPSKPVSLDRRGSLEETRKTPPPASGFQPSTASLSVRSQRRFEPPRRSSGSPFRNSRASVQPESSEQESNSDSGSTSESDDEYAHMDQALYPPTVGQTLSRFREDIPYYPISNHPYEVRPIPSQTREWSCMNARDYNQRLLTARRMTKGRFYDMHTDAEHLSESLQPERVFVEYKPTEKGFVVDEKVVFKDMDRGDGEWKTVGGFDIQLSKQTREHPIAITVGQFQALYSLHRKRFGAQ